MHLQESGEMYLETILVLSRRLNKVRSVDVAEEMGYSKPSVSRAVGILKKNGYIIMDGSGHLYFTYGIPSLKMTSRRKIYQFFPPSGEP